MDVADARRLKAPEDENSKLKKVLAETMLDNAILNDIAATKTNARRPIMPETSANPACR